MQIYYAIIVGGYFATLLGFGIYFSRRVKSEADFFVAGKRLGYWVVSFSARATGESGWLILGLTGMGWAVGIHALWIVLGEVAGVTVSWILMTRRFKALTDRYGSITVPGYLSDRLEDRGHVIQMTSAAILAVMVTSYIAAQLTATGKAFRDFLGIDFAWGASLGLGIVVFYTMTGGFFAVAWSDLVQGIMMFAALIVIPVAALARAGGLSAVISNLGGQDPALLSVFGPHGLSWQGIASAVGFVGIGLAYLGSPQLYVRFMAIRDRGELINGSFVAVLFTIITDMGAVFTGMAGRALYQTLSDQEAILPTLTTALFPPLVTAFFIAAVLAAIMSTSDSLLILASSAFVRDIYHKIVRPIDSEKHLVHLSRLVTLVISAVALCFALQRIKLVYWLALFGWAGIGAAFCPAVILTLFWKRTTRAGVISGMLTGFAVTVIWYCFKDRLGGLYELIPAFICSLLTIVAVSLFTKEPPRAEMDMKLLKRELNPGGRMR